MQKPREPSSFFQDEVYTKGVNSEARDKDLPKMQTRTWMQFKYKEEQQSGASSGRAFMSEAKVARAALKVQQSKSVFSGVGGKQNPTFLLLLKCP